MPVEDQGRQPGASTAAAPRRRATWNGIFELPRRALGRRPRRLLTLAMIVATASFSYVALRNIDLALAWRALRTTDYLWIVGALSVFGLSIFARALRWRALFARHRRPSVGVVMNATMVGYLYNNILPARAGEAARVVVLTQRSSTAPAEIVGTVVVERLDDLFAILLIFFVAQPWLPHESWTGAAALAAIVLAALIAAVVILLAVYDDRPLRLLLRPFRRLPLLSGERLEQTVAELAHGLTGLRHWTLALEAFLWTIAAWMLTALCAYLTTRALHLQVPFACGVLVAVAVGLSMILPSPPAAAGVFEGAALIALKAYSIPYSSALPYALVLHLINFVPFVVGGTLFLQHNARHPQARRTHRDRAAQVGPQLGQPDQL